MVSAIRHRWLIPVVTTLGALIGNLLVFRFAPEAEGHGTDAAIDSFHHKGGAISCVRLRRQGHGAGNAGALVASVLLCRQALRVEINIALHALRRHPADAP